MRIQLNKNLYFNSDQWCCWVTQESPPAEGKKYTRVENISGYHPTIKACFVSMARKEIMGKKDISSFKNLVNSLEDLSSDIHDWTKKIDEAYREGQKLMMNSLVAAAVAIAVSTCPVTYHCGDPVPYEATYYNGGSGIEGGPNDCYGYPLSEGVIAVDPDVIPLGSTVIIEVDGYKDEYVARDVGGNIRGHRIDIYKDVSLDELNRLGRKEVKVWLK